MLGEVNESTARRKEVERLVMLILSGTGTRTALEDLRGISRRGHHALCILRSSGSSPAACFCGFDEARNFIRLYDGAIRGANLIR